VTFPDPTALGPPDWPALRAKLPGGLVLPGDPGYPAASRSHNQLFDGHRPAAIATCTRPEDVQACVEVAQNSKTPVAARSGGHSYAGYCTPNGGLVVDVSRMAGVQVGADGTAVIGAGTTLIDVYTAVAKAGRCLPAGSCPTVGIAGLTLGGGIGVLTRKFGLTCDSLVSAKVVTADARLLDASASSEPDLFWTLRGGGGGNLGIVTSFTFSTVPAPALTVFSLRFPAGSVSQVFSAWQQWIAGAPDELWSNCVISSGKPPVCRVGGCYVGGSRALNPLLDNLIANSAAVPTSRFVSGKDYLAAMRYFAGTGDRSGFVATSRMLTEPVDADRIMPFVDGQPGLDLLVDSFGGAVSRVPVDATAFPHRKALASIQIYAETTTSARDGAVRTVAEVRDGIGKVAGQSGYVNYLDPEMPNWPDAYYGANLPRLRTAAKKYDSDGVFTFPQSLLRA
jgi:hypothetical protein